MARTCLLRQTIRRCCCGIRERRMFTPLTGRRREERDATRIGRIGFYSECFYFILIVRPFHPGCPRVVSACARYDPVNRSVPEPAAQTWHGPVPSRFAHIK